MSRSQRWAAAAAVVIALVAWWAVRSGPLSTLIDNTHTTRASGSGAAPHFPSRVTQKHRHESVRAPSEQDSLALAYPQGTALSCPAPGLVTGHYQVTGSVLRHLYVDNGVLVGVLSRPADGSGFLLTQRGEYAATLTWSEEGCQTGSMASSTVSGIVLNNDGEPVADVEVVGCAGDFTRSQPDGTFTIELVTGRTCWAFTFREDEDGFAKGPMVEIIGGQSAHATLEVPGQAVSASKQRRQLEQGAHQMMALLDQQYASPSPVTQALERVPDNPLLQAWSDDETKLLNLKYDELEYLLSPDANDEDWRDIWLFGIGN
jgi:hypothetical protein